MLRKIAALVLMTFFTTTIFAEDLAAILTLMCPKEPML